MLQSTVRSALPGDTTTDYLLYSTLSSDTTTDYQLYSTQYVDATADYPLYNHTSQPTNTLFMARDKARNGRL
jgi:hypothetical protein